MGLIELLVTLLLVGFLLWIINTYAAAVIDGKILTLINLVVVFCVVVWLLRVFGVLTGLGNIRVGP